MSEAFEHNMLDGRPRVTHRPLNPEHSGAVLDRPRMDGKGDHDRLLMKLIEVHPQMWEEINA